MALKVYKASAGSGKTFTLAVEYIKLLIINPYNYKHILAVTFTNKATAEMKTRIISKLNAIASNDPDGDDYVNKIRKYDEIKKLDISDTEFRRRAGIALTSMLHDYSRFRIETIDSFFQSVIRELAHELDLTANLRVDLNDNEVLAEAVESIINDIENDKSLFDTIKTFIEDKTEESPKKWQINSEVELFGRNIFNEEYLQKGQEIREKIGNTKFLSEYKRKLHTIRNSVNAWLKEKGNTFLNDCKANGYSVDSFSYGKSGIHNFFVKLSNGIIPDVGSRVLKALEDDKSWMKDKKDSTLQSLVQSKFMPLLSEIINELPDQVIKLNSSRAILSHINHLMLLNVINVKVRNLNQEANRFLLADTAHFLNELIDGNDIPFIYEKMGTRFNHIMIDEFQDTSRMQWENFKPLLSNSLSAGYDCLIVGDVKQSIYRWRHSDWQILNNIKSSIFSSYIKDDDLDTNFRSSERIITFNNAFFPKGVTAINSCYEKTHGEESKALSSAYKKVAQKVNDKNKGRGYVCVKALGKDEEHDYTSRSLEEMEHTIALLKSKGVKDNDITILIRTNSDAQTISEYFSSHKDVVDVSIVSNEAFRLDFSPAINIIITVLRTLADKDDSFALANLAYLYQKHVKRNETVVKDVNTLFLAEDGKINDYLPEAFINKDNKFTFLPILELVEKIYAIFNLEVIPNQDAYLFYFHDQLSAYCEDNRTDINSFLQYWDEKMYKATIPNGVSDGIRIMTIHKSKGLEFQTVIMPFCDWETTGKNENLLWCEPQEEPFSELPLAPVNFNINTRDSIFKEDYQEEELRNSVDNLNLIYVGFTRAVDNLFVIMKDSDMPKNNKITRMNQLIKLSMPSSIGDAENGEAVEEIAESDDEDNNIHTWEVGDISASGDDKEEHSNVKAKFRYFDSLVDYRQSNKSSKFINEDAESENQEEHPYSFIDRGLLFHHALELITTTDDIDEEIDRVMEELELQGCFKSILEKKETTAALHKALDNKQARSWFDTKWEVRNESSIIFKSKEKVTDRRPDRVIISDEETIVIDYKTGEEIEEHKKQVRFYMNLLKRMGYKGVKGFVWYLLEDKIEDVELLQNNSLTY